MIVIGLRISTYFLLSTLLRMYCDIHGINLWVHLTVNDLQCTEYFKELYCSKHGERFSVYRTFYDIR